MAKATETGPAEWRMTMRRCPEMGCLRAGRDAVSIKPQFSLQRGAGISTGFLKMLTVNPSVTCREGMGP